MKKQQKQMKQQGPSRAVKAARTAANKARRISRALAQQAKHAALREKEANGETHHSTRERVRSTLREQGVLLTPEMLELQRLALRDFSFRVWRLADERGISTGAAEALLSGSIDKGVVARTKDVRLGKLPAVRQLITYADGLRVVRVVDAQGRIKKEKAFIKVIGNKQIVQGPITALTYFNMK